MSNYVIPSPYIDRIIINNTKQKEKTINIDMLINLLSPKSLFSPEIELEEEIPKIESEKLKIELLFVRDRTVSQMLDTSMEFVKSIMRQYSQDVQVNIDQLYLSLAKNKGLIENGDQVSFMNMIMAKCTKTTITDPVITSRGENNYLTHIEREVDASSGHVSVYLLVDIDKDNEIASLQEQQNDTFLVGETILDNGKIASFSYGYYTIEDDQIWNGEVKIESDKFYTVETPQRELARRKFYNTKIQDFRVYTKLPIRSNDLMIPEIKKVNDLELMDNRYYLKSSDSPIQFDGRTSAGIKINISMLGLLRKHSVAYNILQQTNSSDLRNLFSPDEIDIKVYRKRVREELGLGYNYHRLELEDFQENEAKYYLPNRDFPYEIRGDLINIRIEDQDYATNITTGDYCYGVELRFSDPINRLLKKDLKDFEITRSGLEEYYKSSTILGYYDSSGNYVEGHYDPETNKFTNKFVSEWNSGGELGNYFRFLSREILTNYTNLMLKTSKKKKEDIEEEIKEIIPLISPKTGTPDNILTFLNLYETNLGLLKRVYEITKNNTINLEEKYFNKYLHKISKRQRQDKLQQLPFSMKRVTINAAGNISAEESFDYSLLRNIIENGSNVDINDDFSKITPRRTTTMANVQPPGNPQSTSILIDREYITDLPRNKLENAIAGILGSPEKTSTKDISNSTITDVYKKQIAKQRRERNK